MKIILSRKGFDGSNGGIESPIFDNGKLLSFPIPSKDSIKYSDLVYESISLDVLLNDLGYKGSSYCHLDPDLVKNRRKQDIPSWTPAFGQINAAAKYLINNNVQEGDLFLFFGNFRHVTYSNGKFKYARKNNSLDKYCNGCAVQLIWGYMQVGKIITNPSEQKKLFWHPHSCDERVYNETNNIIIVPTDKLSFDESMPGSGVFDYSEQRVLTLDLKKKATWKYEKAYDCNNIFGNRKNSATINNGIYYSGIWQELVLKDNNISLEWAKRIFK